MKQFYLLLPLIISFQFASGQIDFTPYPGNNTHCPGELLRYTASGSGCGVFTWTITNGKILNPADNSEVTTLTGTSVDIRWDDVAGTGKLRVSSTCSGEAKFEEKSFAIRSLAGRVPQNLRANQSLPYCSTNTINLSVDDMLLLNTGGSTGIIQKFADGYEWSLPTGWSFNGPSNTSIINIYPDNGCRGGTVTVKAYVNCGSGKKYSAPATISVNRIGFSSNLGVPSGYTGPKCGNTSPVTFTAANLSCAQSYRWTATNTNWRDGNGALGPWTTATNTITLYPSGNSTDQGIIAVDINIGCAILNQTYSAVYSNPPLPTPVFATSSATLLCSGGSSTVAVNSVAEASSYTWYTTSDLTIYVNGAVRPASSPLITTTPSVSISVPTFSTGYANTIYVKANRASTSCEGSITNFRNVWAGKPLNVLNPEDLEGPPCILRGTYDEFLGVPWPVVVPGATQYEPSIVFGGTSNGITFYSDINRVRVEVHVASNASLGTYTLQVRPKNTCGSASAAYSTFQTTDDYYCQGGGMLLSVSPNPTADELTIEMTEDTKQDYLVMLIDKTGQVKKQLTATKKRLTMTTADFPNGVYYLVVKSSDKSDYRQVIINH